MLAEMAIVLTPLNEDISPENNKYFQINLRCFFLSD